MTGELLIFQLPIKSGKESDRSNYHPVSLTRNIFNLDVIMI